MQPSARSWELPEIVLANLAQELSGKGQPSKKGVSVKPPPSIFWHSYRIGRFIG